MTGPRRKAGLPPRVLTIVNRRGLHARAAGKFAKLAESFDARILVEKDDMRVEGTSIMGLLMLSASTGTAIAVSATGPDAPAALDALEALVSGGFEETD
ncbi:MAG: HPr family phosphocarrier protein [Alphaproteobacteria bacterium]